MAVSFPFETRHSSVFKIVSRPIAVVSFWSKVISDWTRITMVVDTGADYTILPRNEAINLGIDLLKDCVRFQTYGVGGKETVYLRRSWKVKLGNIELSVPIGFLDTDDIPPLLGRQDFLEKLDIRLFRHTTSFSK